MTQYGTLRLWAVFLTFIGVLGMLAAAAGTIVLAIEVDGFWRTIGILLFGVPASILFAALPVALAQALRALADIGDTVAAR